MEGISGAETVVLAVGAFSLLAEIRAEDLILFLPHILKSISPHIALYQLRPAGQIQTADEIVFPALSFTL